MTTSKTTSTKWLNGLFHAALCALATGCASTRLVDEWRTPPFSDLVRIDASLPSRSYPISAHAPTGEIVRVGVREIASDDPLAKARPVLVLLNGVFSDGSTWRFVTGPLSRRYDLLVVDTPGTGASIVPDPDGLSEQAFTPTWLGGVVWSVLRQWQDRSREPRPIVLVGHSVAGAVILRMLGDPGLRRTFEREREWSRAAVLIAAADVGTDAWSPVLVDLAKVSDEEVALGDSLGFLTSEVEAGIFKSVEHPEVAALRREAERMVAALRDRDERRASQLMLRRIRPIDGRERPIWSEIRPMMADHRRVDVPIMLLWGRLDDILPLSTGSKLEREIPLSQLVVIDDARHSVHQEQPLAVTDAISRFVDRPPERPDPRTAP